MPYKSEDKHRLNSRKYRYEHREEISAYGARYYQKHRAKIMDSATKYYKRCVRESTDIKYYIKRMVNNLKSRSKRGNVPFNLTYEYVHNVYQKQRGLCFYMDIPMEWGFGRGRHSQLMTFDKIVAQLGYIQGNVVLCTWRANVMKSDLDLEGLRFWIPKFYDKLNMRMAA